MPLITVENCLKEENNRFKLVLAAAYRARSLATGSHPLVEEEGDKVTVLALREIEEEKQTISGLFEQRRMGG